MSLIEPGGERFTVTCDHGGCAAKFECPYYVGKRNARKTAIRAGWQFCSGSGGRRDFCPRHHRGPLTVEVKR